MGKGLSTKIVYGYDIGGGEEEGWNFEEYDGSEYEMKWPDWVDRDALDDDDNDPNAFISQAKDRLLTQLTGFKILDYGDPARPGDYYDQKRAAEKKLGLNFATYGVGDYTEWTLGFELARDHDGLGELDHELIATLLNPLNMADMDYRLREAVRVLQLHPRGQAAPRLLLLASYF